MDVHVRNKKIDRYYIFTGIICILMLNYNEYSIPLI